MSWITANGMAGGDLSDQKSFRRALRKAAFSWHKHNDRWRVPAGSTKHTQMLEVFEQWSRK